MRRITWILGTVLSVSLVAAPAAHAAKKSTGPRIHAAKQYRTIQITERDVVVMRSPVSAASAKRTLPAPGFDTGRRVLLPNPDGQRQFVIPNPDAQRQFVIPNPDAQRQFVIPNPDAQ